MSENFSSKFVGNTKPSSRHCQAFKNCSSIETTRAQRTEQGRDLAGRMSRSLIP